MLNLIKGNLAKVDPGGKKGRLEGGALALNVNYRKNCQLQTLTEESQQERIIKDRPNRERCTLSLLEEFDYPSNSVYEKLSSP